MKDDDYINEQFREIAFTTVALDAEQLINQVIGLEAESRHEMSCNDDPEAAGRKANEAYGLFMQSTTLAGLPTLVMGFADKFNREHEAYTLALDAIADAKEHIRLALEFVKRKQPAMVEANVESAMAILVQALEDAIYAKTDDPE